MPRPQLWTPILVACFALIALYIFRDPELAKIDSNSRILLLTAHPDDECFFFAPTLLALSAQTDKLFSLTASNGNYDGIGKQREPELIASLAILGIPPERTFLLDHPQLQDNFTQTWDADTIAQAVLPYVKRHKINVLLTFDHLGVSSHPNHCSLYYGAKRLLSIKIDDEPMGAYALRTEPLYIKYTGWLSLLSNLFERQPPKSVTISSRIPQLRFVSGLPTYLRAVKAMHQHQSQMLWFRWLYLAFSSYMWRNDWLEIESDGRIA